MKMPLPYLVLALLVAVVSYVYLSSSGLFTYIVMPPEEHGMLLERLVLVTTICCWGYWGYFVFKLLKFAPNTTDAVPLKRPAGINAAIAAVVLFLVFPGIMICGFSIWYGFIKQPGTIATMLGIYGLSLIVPSLALVLFCIHGIIKGKRLCAALICLPSLLYVTLFVFNWKSFGISVITLFIDVNRPKTAMMVLLVSAVLIYFLDRRDNLLYMQGQRIKAKQAKASVLTGM